MWLYVILYTTEVKLAWKSIRGYTATGQTWP